jgi:C4-dicarboxylate transporter, DctM subunit
VAAVFLLVFGGIYTGWSTPTGAAAIGAAATFVVAIARGELDLTGIKACFYDTAMTSGMIFMLFLGADILNSALALSQFPAALAGVVENSGLPPLAVIAGILVFYVMLGCVMDEISMILLTLPIFLPTVAGLELFGLGQSEKIIWFGILVLMVVEIGLIMPPVGLNVYVINGLARDIPIRETYIGVMPFIASDFIRTALLLAFPALSLWLVKVLVP